MAEQTINYITVAIIAIVVIIGVLFFYTDASASVKDKISNFFKGAEEQVAGVKQVVKEESEEGEVIDPNEYKGEFLAGVYYDAIGQAINGQKECIQGIDRELVKDITDASSFTVEQVFSQDGPSSIKSYYRNNDQVVYGTKDLAVEPCICNDNVCNDRVGVKIRGDYRDIYDEDFELINNFVKNPILFRKDNTHVCLVDANLAKEYIGFGRFGYQKRLCSNGKLTRGNVDSISAQGKLREYLEKEITVDGNSARVKDLIAFMSKGNLGGYSPLLDVETKSFFDSIYGEADNTCWGFLIDYPEHEPSVSSDFWINEGYNIGLETGTNNVYGFVPSIEMSGSLVIDGETVNLYLYEVTKPIDLGVLAQQIRGCLYLQES